MTEIAEGKRSFDWLQKKFGIIFESLDNEQQKLIKTIGESGLNKLVAQRVKEIEKNKGRKKYRGGTLTKSESLNLAQNVATLFGFGKPRFVGPGSKSVHNEPEKWGTEELEELMDVEGVD